MINLNRNNFILKYTNNCIIVLMFCVFMIYFKICIYFQNLFHFKILLLGSFTTCIELKYNFNICYFFQPYFVVFCVYVVFLNVIPF